MYLFLIFIIVILYKSDNNRLLVIIGESYGGD